MFYLVNYTFNKLHSYTLWLFACSAYLCGFSKQPPWFSDSDASAEEFGRIQHRLHPAGDSD